MRVESSFVGKSLHRRTGGEPAIVTNRPPRDRRPGKRADDRTKKGPGDLSVDLKHISLELILRTVSRTPWPTWTISKRATDEHDAGAYRYWKEEGSHRGYCQRRRH